MGTDIHYIVEKKWNGKWLGLFGNEPDPGDDVPANERSYQIFTRLAKVRAEVTEERGYSADGYAPRGVPEDASELTRYQTEENDGGGHTFSWLTLEEFCGVFVKLAEERGVPGYYGPFPWEKIFGYFSVDSPKHYRVVFWFDN